MKLILYKLVIAVVVSACCSELLFPDKDGCSQQYDDNTDMKNCTHTVFCFNYVHRKGATTNEECQNHIYMNGYTYDPLSVILKYDQNYDLTPKFGDSYDYKLVYSLDLSDNEAFYVPDFNYMPNLVTLKMLRCSLNTAKLSNKNELPALVDIDYSQNNINNIEVVPDEHEYKALKKLNVSHNGLVNIPEAIFELFPNIESLDLSSNFLHALDIMYFDGIRKLLHLNLSNNELTDINSSLLRLKYLVTLNLSYNKLKTLKAADFTKLVNLQEIKLESNNINNIEKNVFGNMASLKTVDLRDNVLENIYREIFINATNLATVYLSRNKLKTFPKNMFQGKVIINFGIEGNEIQGSLERGTFEGLTMVTELDLSFQHISSVENYAFAGLHNLKSLLLNNNDMESLRNYSFKGLQNLNCLDLSYNRINNLEIVTEDLIHLQIFTLNHNMIAHISSRNFISLGSLQLLDLSHNNISYLEPNYFRSLQSLLNFKISENPLSGAIKEKTFDGLGSLPSLDISGSLITTINNGSLVGMTALTDLNVSHSNITELQYNSLSYAGNIQAIDLSFNRLSVFDVNTTDLRYIKTLMLNNNLLQVISQTVFSGLRVLSTVDLSHNEIRTIHKEAFYTLEDIRNLDLSYNPELVFDISLIEKARNLASLYLSGTKVEVTFENINDIALAKLEMAHSGIRNFSRLNLHKLHHLQTIVLSNNAASKLEVNDLSNLTNLQQLDLSYNNLNCIQPGAFKDNPYLKSLNISHNKLFEINYGIFRGLMSVEVIDLSYNLIKSLHRSRFYGIEHLQSLIVDYNEIDFISDEEFAGTTLSKLSIGGNPLPCELLASLKKKSYQIGITSIKKDITKTNIDGVTCYNDGHIFNSRFTPTNAEHDKLLLDIRNILYNVSKEKIVKQPIEAKLNDFPYLANITEQEQKNNQHSLEIINSIKNLSSINNLTSIINTNTNLLLGKILRVLTGKEAIPPTNQHIKVNNENATSDSLVSYINKIKQDLEYSIAVEKQNILQLDDKIAKLDSKIFSPVTMKPEHEKLIRANEDRPKSSMFTEVCVGLILVILIVFILFKVYKSRLYIPNVRSMTSSTRNIADSMESANL